MSTQADLDLAEHKVVRDERVKERNRIQRLLIRPEMGALIGAIAIFIFFLIVAPPFRTPEALATVLYASSTIGIMACAVALLMIGGEFDLSAGVAVTTQFARRVDAGLQPAPEPVGGCGVGAGPVAGGRVLQRLPGDEDQDPELPDHAGHVLDVDRHQPRCDETGFGPGRHAERERHAGLGFGAERCSRRRSRSSGCQVRITVLWWLLFTAIATYVLFKTQDRQLDLRRRR